MPFSSECKSSVSLGASKDTSAGRLKGYQFRFLIERPRNWYPLVYFSSAADPVGALVSFELFLAFSRR